METLEPPPKTATEYVLVELTTVIIDEYFVAIIKNVTNKIWKGPRGGWTRSRAQKKWAGSLHRNPISPASTS